MYVLYESKDRVGYITLNRPEKKNAFSFQVVQELKEAFTTAEHDETAKLIVLQANGDTFCAGADLAYLQQLQNFSYEDNLADSNHLKSLYYQVYTMKKLVLGSVQGHALGGGCGLVTVCDFVFSVPEAKLGYTEVKIGFIPAIVMVFLLRKVGEGKAKELLLTGDLIKAEEAVYYGLVNKIVGKDKLNEHVRLFAQHLIQQNSATSMMLTKQMISQVQSMNLESALSFAAQMNANARGSEDCKKGIGAFLKKEKINW
jgi:methylglutaconyl-CoA hydratase